MSAADLKPSEFAIEPAMINIDEKQAEAALKGITIPPHPRIMQEVADVFPEIDAVTKIVLKDPSITGAIIKTINSAGFGLRREITTLKEAIMLLGLDSIINIINTILLKNAYNEAVAPEKLESFWTCTNDVAVACRSLAKELSLGQPDLFYLLGLFHNCGIPLMMMKFPKYQAVQTKCYGQNQYPITAIENHLFKSNHTAAGFFMARSWKLPDVVATCIKQHHNHPLLIEQFDQPSNELSNLLAVLKMGEDIAREHFHLGQQALNHEFDVLKPHLFNYVGIEESTYLDLTEVASEAIAASYE